MPVFLCYGRDQKNNLINISEENSGKTKLVCPFCGCALIAAKGEIKSHHFRHDGKTCQESLSEIPQIQGWDKFDLHYPLDVINELNKSYLPHSKYPKYFHKENVDFSIFKRQYQEKLIEETWGGGLGFTLEAQVILGGLSLSKFSKWMRESLQRRYLEIDRMVKEGFTHKAWLEIELSRQESILNSTLYLFEYQFEDKTKIYKVGRSARDLNIRLNETLYDVQKATGKKVKSSKILNHATSQGYVEQYVFHKYKDCHLPLGDHKEYLQLNDKQVRSLKSEITRLNNQATPFIKEERFIASGRWRYEEKRLEASKAGIKATLRENGKFGRPVGTKLSDEDFEAKYKKVIELLERNDLTNKNIARMVNVSLSTVKRVKTRIKLSNKSVNC